MTLADQSNTSVMTAYCTPQRLNSCPPSPILQSNGGLSFYYTVDQAIRQRQTLLACFVSCLIAGQDFPDLW